MFAGDTGEAQDFLLVLAAAEILTPHPNIQWLMVGDGRMAQIAAPASPFFGGPPKRLWS